jgi:hypothetical protein
MPSTYTSNLGIEKPGDGEQDGIWGDTVNENSDILDRAINGVLSLSLSGTSSTLTTSDGVLSNGQYKYLALTGTPPSLHTITISPNDAQKIYYVANATAQTVRFQQGSGVTASIAAGDSAIVVAFGTGATSGVTRFTDYLGMTSPNITGGSITGVTVSGGTVSGAAVSGGTVSGAAITTGTINNTPVGATTASTGRFTSVAANTITNAAADGGPTFTKGYTESIFAITGTSPVLDPNNGSIQTWTLTGNSTPTENFVPGQSMTLMISDGTAFSITWPSVAWKSDGGFPPTLNLTTLTAIALWKVGLTLYGARVGDA